MKGVPGADIVAISRFQNKVNDFPDDFFSSLQDILHCLFAGVFVNDAEYLSVRLWKGLNDFDGFHQQEVGLGFRLAREHSSGD
jgi:hypothetical protein